MLITTFFNKGSNKLNLTKSQSNKIWV